MKFDGTLHNHHDKDSAERHLKRLRWQRRQAKPYVRRLIDLDMEYTDKLIKELENAPHST